jgi:hypothetical protein
MAEADPVPATTRIELADSSLTGAVTTALNPPVILRLADPNGVPLSGVPVAWMVLDGGSVTPLAPRTDSLGQVVGRWTLGRRVGKQRLKVQVGDARTMPAFTVSAVATPGAPASLTIVTGADQRVAAGKPARPIILQVRDSLGNAVPGVTFVARATSGMIGDSAPASDKSGRVALHWTAGRSAGPATLTLLSQGSALHTSIAVSVAAAAVKPATAVKAAPAKRAPARPTNSKKPR